MELDDLKSTWNSQGGNTENQDLTFKIIDQMTQKKYKSKIKKITYPEIIGSLICLIAAVFIAINLYKLDTVFLKGVGVLSIVLLLLLPILSFLSLRRLTMSENVNKPYAEALKAFAIQKLKFYKLQKINILLSYLLLVTTIILMSKFFSGKDLTNSKYFWIFSFTIGYIFLLFFSTTVLKVYKNTLRQAEELLQELQP
jgi:hypothetical protein